MKAKLYPLLALIVTIASIATVALAGGFLEFSSNVMVNDGAVGLQRGSIVTKTTTGDYIIIWQDSADGGNHYAQKMDIDGNLLWGADVQLTNVNGSDYFDVVADNAGGVFELFEGPPNGLPKTSAS